MTKSRTALPGLPMAGRAARSWAGAWAGISTIALSSVALAPAAVSDAAPPTAAAARPAAPPVASVASVAPSGGLVVDVDKAQVLSLPAAGATVFIANPDIADVQAVDSQRILIFGKKPGQTTAYVFSRGGGVRSFEITVRRSAGEAAEALRRQAPGADLQASRDPNGMTVSGRVASPAEAEAVQAIAQQYLADKEALNYTAAVVGDTQVNLQVRVAEVSREVSRNLGFNWNALFNNGKLAVGVMTGRPPATAFGDFIRSDSSDVFGSIGVGYQNGSVNMSALVDALQANGLISVLAEPNLTAVSGTTANFLAGGEFPVPVAQGLNQISIEWKRFGISLEFTPTVLDPNRISIRVRPEVSQLSDTGAVVISNIKVPSIQTRRADTTVELASGQSFAIAGLFQNNITSSVNQYPGLGDLPILGPLFRSSRFQRHQTELVIIVTPYIVRPVSRPGDLRLPTEAITYSNPLEQILLGRVSNRGAAEGRPRLAGPAGFMLEEQP